MAQRDPSRLLRARAIDRLVAGVITAGGSLIQLAVAFLMVFLVNEALPLMRGAEFGKVSAAQAPPRPLVAFDDEYRENSMVVGADGVLHVAAASGEQRCLPLEGARSPLSAERTKQ